MCFVVFISRRFQPRSQGFSLFVIGKKGKSPGNEVVADLAAFKTDTGGVKVLAFKSASFTVIIDD
jgi:hypothetical protein